MTNKGKDGDRTEKDMEYEATVSNTLSFIGCQRLRIAIESLQAQQASQVLCE